MLASKKNILFLIESLDGGGAEKVLSTMMCYIDKKKYNVMVLAISGGGVYENSISSNVNYRCVLSRNVANRGVRGFLYKLKSKLIYDWLPMRIVYYLIIPKGYDVEVAFVEGFATKLLAASCNRLAKKIAWVHVDLVQRPWTLTSGVYDSLKEERWAYEKYDNVVCVSKSVERVMRESYKLTSTLTIYNPIDVLAIKQKGCEFSPFKVDNTKFNIVSVGRMAWEKGYDVLLPIIQKVKQTYPNVHLWLIGTGVEEMSVKKLTADLNIEKNVTFTGFLKNPYSLMSKMDLFVCSSRAEGFSLVIAESMALGVPVISTNCSGPNELIGRNEYGVLCDTYDELEREILKAIKVRPVHKGVPPIVDINETMNRIYELLG